MRTLLKGGTLALPNGPTRADLLIEGETIAAIGERLPAHGAQVVDADGCVVLPGAIDTHTHMDLPVSGTVTADNFDTGTRAALLGGTTTILDFATQNRGDTLRAGYDTWQTRLHGNIHCDVGLHMAVTDWNEKTAAEIGEMPGLGISSYKMYMAYPALMVEDDAIYRALQRIAQVGGIAGFHCENGRLVGAMTAQLLSAGRTGPQVHPLSRPPAVEAEAISRLLRIAWLAGAPVNIVHLSSLEGLQAIRDTKKPGQRVYVETCPQYLLLDDSVFSREDAAKYICSPPIRKREDAQALWQALASGEIDTVGTDHCSFDYARQKKPFEQNFAKIPNGLPGVEHRLALMMTEGVDAGRMSLARLVEVLCEHPAKLFGLCPRKGILAPGSDADIAIWDARLAHTITAAGQSQHVDYTPYEGIKTTGGVRDVWLRGTRSVQSGRVIAPHRGQYLYRNAPFAAKK